MIHQHYFLHHFSFFLKGKINDTLAVQARVSSHVNSHLLEVSTHVNSHLFGMTQFKEFKLI